MWTSDVMLITSLDRWFRNAIIIIKRCDHSQGRLIRVWSGYNNIIAALCSLGICNNGHPVVCLVRCSSDSVTCTYDNTCHTARRFTYILCRPKAIIQFDIHSFVHVQLNGTSARVRQCRRRIVVAVAVRRVAGEHIAHILKLWWKCWKRRQVFNFYIRGHFCVVIIF